jgi:hypothetical protein
MSFQSYRDTVFEPWLLPIILARSKLTEGSKISDGKLGKIPGDYNPNTNLWCGRANWTAEQLPAGSHVPAIWDSWYPEGHQTIGLQARLFPGIDLDIDPRAGQLQTAMAKSIGGKGFK